MKPILFYDVLPDMQCLQGSTLPVFVVDVEGGSLSGCAVTLVLEQFPDSEKFTKPCTVTENGFEVQLTSQDTAALSGLYQMSFVITDSTGLNHITLKGSLHVRMTSQEAET